LRLEIRQVLDLPWPIRPYFCSGGWAGCDKQAQAESLLPPSSKEQDTILWLWLPVLVISIGIVCRGSQRFLGGGISPSLQVSAGLVWLPLGLQPVTFLPTLRIWLTSVAEGLPFGREKKSGLKRPSRAPSEAPRKEKT